MEDIEKRLRSHTDDFDGLLSLIPAKNYYAPNPGTQWKKRKQSKAESARIKKAKLDPDALFSAAEVRDKRVLESGGEDEGVKGEDADMDEDEVEVRQSMTVGLSGGEKKGKGGEEESEREGGIGDEGMLRRKRKIRTKTDNTERRRQQKQENPSKIDMRENQPSHTPVETLVRTTEAEKKKLKRAQKTEEEKEKKDEIKRAAPNKLGKKEAANTDSRITLPGLPNDSNVNSVYAPESGTPISASPTLSNTTAATSPPSSIPEPQSIAGSNTVADKIKSESILDMRARLAARIEALRAARKAIGTKPSDPNGPTPPRNRQELMDARAKKEALRKAKRAEAKAKEKAAAAAAAAAATAVPPTNGIVASSSRGTSVDGHVSPAPSISANYNFGKVVFDDGEALDASLRSVASSKERKRASSGDTKALLEQVQRKKARLDGMDEGKRERVEESERWGKAIAKVAGEKVKDDEKLLKKAMKRVEARKRKSEREWNERAESIAKAKASKQKKREDNLAKRKEQKKLGKTAKGKINKVSKKVKFNKKDKRKKPNQGRPGFEGGLGSRARVTGGGLPKGARK